MRNFMIAALASIALTGGGAPSTPDFVQKAAMSDMMKCKPASLPPRKVSRMS